MFYLLAPATPGDLSIRIEDPDGARHEATVPVRSLRQLRQPFDDNDTQWPRRWPLGSNCVSLRTRQTLQDEPLEPAGDNPVLDWWLQQDDTTLWRQLPAAEFPRAHYVNVHQGCPGCGTAIFAHHGYYPWKRDHLPADLRSTCPACAAVFPSNDLRRGDYSTGEYVDDGFGWFDDEGHVFLFAASSHRELVSQFSGGLRAVTAHLRRQPDDLDCARRLGLMLLRWSLEEVYLAAAPQFRHGPSQEIEQAWDGGPVDWVGQADPVAALYRKGSLAYAIDVPIVTEILALAYDTAWPVLHTDTEWVTRARAQGLPLTDAADGCQLIEEALCCLIQCGIDGAALSNKPRTSLGVLYALRALDRPDTGDVLAWLYDEGPDRLRVFVTNNFTVDGMPPEATGGYNDTHTRGVFDLEHQMAALRQQQPQAFPLALFPPVTDDPRLERLVRAPYDIVVLGRIPLHFGDGGSSGVQSPLTDTAPLQPLGEQTLHQAAALGSTAAADLLESRPHTPGSTIHDGVGFAILRTDETPERAAAAIIYGDAPWHRHQDLLDTQLFAFDRPFLTPLGYPQSWAHVNSWEGNWATHNAMWSVVEGVEPLDLPFDTPWHYLKEIAGRGRLLRTLSVDGVQIVEVEAWRWAFDPERMAWRQIGVSFRRLLALVETSAASVALVDLARINGGDEHWRVCRGLQGTLQLPGVGAAPRSGTLAGEDIDRGQLDRVRHGDHRGLAWMDDVELLDLQGPTKASWTSAHEPMARLDLHILATTAGTCLRSARATAVMDAPERSRYEYRTLAWQRSAPTGTTAVDLVFEPSLGQATLLGAAPIPADDSGLASGVRLQTLSGETCLYWSPGAESSERTRFQDGTELCGALAVVRHGRAGSVVCAGAGSAGISHRAHKAEFDRPCQDGCVLALDRRACSIDVSGLSDIEEGDRITLNPAGRAHTYRIAQHRRLTADTCRLTLDMASVHGRARIVRRQNNRLELDFFLITRTATLRHTRLQLERDGAWQTIMAACNADGYSTTVDLDAPLAGASEGDWVAAVDYVVGDVVRLEKQRVVQS